MKHPAASVSSSRTAPAHPTDRSAFTIVELLAVIAVIAILAAILFPAIGSAREKSYTAKCMSNLRQWGAACTTYLGDHDGIFPEESVKASGEIVLTNMVAWFNVLAPLVGEPSLYDRAAAFSKPQPRPRDGSLYTCPAATDKEMRDYEQTSGKTLNLYNDPYMSYSYNLWIDHGQRAAEHGGTTGFGTLLRMSQLLKPSRFVVFSEVAGNAGNCHAAFLAYRHPHLTVNISFADGHVATYASNDVYVSSSASNWKSQNRGGIIWDPEGTPPQSDPSF